MTSGMSDWEQWDDDPVVADRGNGHSHREVSLEEPLRATAGRGGGDTYVRKRYGSDRRDEYDSFMCEGGVGGNMNSWGGPLPQHDRRGGGHGGADRRGGDREERVSDRRDQMRDAVVEPQPPITYIPKEEENVEELFKHSIISGINFSKYEHIECKVSGQNPPHAIKDFNSSGLRKLLLENVRKAKYSSATPVQKYAIPIIKEGRDLMACAQTGSGKTAAFFLPILHRLLEEGVDTKAGSFPQMPEVIVMSPTRELATQIKEQAMMFARGSMVRCVVLYGGVSIQYQSEQVLRGVNVLIATPGRLLDFVERGKISFKNVRFLVLDEADRLLDMGFMPDIERMVRNPEMPSKEHRQTLMFSATFPKEVQEIATEFLNDYLFLAVGRVGGACDDVTQSFFKVAQYQKREKLMDLLKDLPNLGQEKTLIFVDRKKTADFVATYLSETEYPATSIHGDRLQEQREIALADFKSGRRPILVATAVAARGLDIPNVAHVINYDMPASIDEYVHRIGRSGRIGNTGRATSFYDASEDGPIAKDLVQVLVDAHQEVPDWLKKEADANMLGSGGGRGFRGSHDWRESRGFGDGGGFKAQDVLDEDERWDN